MDEPQDMTHKSLQRLFAGWKPADGDLAALLRFFEDFDRTYPTPSVSHLEATHLAAILAAVQDSAPRD